MLISGGGGGEIYFLRRWRRNLLSKKKEILIMHLKNITRVKLSDSLEYILEFGATGQYTPLRVIQDCLITLPSKTFSVIHYKCAV